MTDTSKYLRLVRDRDFRDALAGQPYSASNKLPTEGSVGEQPLGEAQLEVAR